MRVLVLVIAISVSGLMFSAFTPKNDLVVTSKSFGHNSMMPMKFSCEGENISPELSVHNIPSKTKSLAMIMHDPDAPMKGGFTHWVVWNLDVQPSIPENFQGAQQGVNSAHKNGYIGMCPPSGTHHYHFMVYALDRKLDISTSTDKAGLEKAIKGHVLAKGLLTGLYKKVK